MRYPQKHQCKIRFYFLIQDKPDKPSLMPYEKRFSAYEICSVEKTNIPRQDRCQIHYQSSDLSQKADVEILN